MDRSPLILITGMSGAGRSTALKILEDHGFEAIDNLPISLLEALLNRGKASLAVGIDIRTQDFNAQELESFLKATHPNWQPCVVFLDCEDEVLVRRYVSNRRRHPLGESSLQESIKHERQIIAPIREMADYLIETSRTTPYEFAKHFSKLLSSYLPPTPLSLEVISFSYRYGLPIHADFVLDARFLPNPYYDPHLKYRTGQDGEVIQMLEHEQAWQQMLPLWQEMLTKSLQGFRNHGRSYVTIACGCTGGQHRSVFVAEQLARWLEQQGEAVRLQHRDLHVSH